MFIFISEGDSALPVSAQAQLGWGFCDLVGKCYLAKCQWWMNDDNFETQHSEGTMCLLTNPPAHDLPYSHILECCFEISGNSFVSCNEEWVVNCFHFVRKYRWAVSWGNILWWTQWVVVVWSCQRFFVFFRAVRGFSLIGLMFAVCYFQGNGTDLRLTDNTILISRVMEQYLRLHHHLLLFLVIRIRFG